jgi:integrase
VTATEISRHASLLERLMVAVRPEFRTDVLFADATDPILRGAGCHIHGCPRPLRARGLCQGHYNRWFRQGRPPLEEYRATTSPALSGRKAPRPCVAPGCRYCRSYQGFCDWHDRAWKRAGRPDRAMWLPAAPPAPPAPPAATCRLGFCDLWAAGNGPFCRSHYQRWRELGQPEVEAFVRRCERYGDECFDFRPLPPQLRLELQYAVQRRHDERRSMTRPETVNRVIRAVARSGVASLLDWPEAAWRAYVLGERGRRSGTPRSEPVFAAYARQQLEDLQHGDGWEAEYPRDVWRLRRLGIQGTYAYLRFDRISQPWLKALAKRWLRLRLTSGLSSGQAGKHLAGITRFATFLAAGAIGVDRLADADRAVLERFLGELAGLPGPRTHGETISSLNAFFQVIRRHQWDETLPTSAAFFPEDYPARPKRLPRYLAEHVMAQVERADNLERWRDRADRLVTLILIRCGLRISDACRLEFDCIVRDAQGAPYLRYLNHKMKREAAVPIDDELAAEVQRQQHRVLGRWPNGAKALFPQQKMNPDGQKPYSASTYRNRLEQWLAACDVRDEQGRPVHLTPHQWRHTFGTRLVDNDVPLEVVRVLLDHDSLEMSGHYARLKDQTVRKHWERARKVNCHGEEVTIEPDSPLADAQWVKHRVGLAKQALPNGYCGLPLVRTCPHANASLTELAGV